MAKRRVPERITQSLRRALVARPATRVEFVAAAASSSCVNSFMSGNMVN
jgi:hypothetical protein